MTNEEAIERLRDVYADVEKRRDQILERKGRYRASEALRANVIEVFGAELEAIGMAIATIAALEDREAKQ